MTETLDPPVLTEHRVRRSVDAHSHSSPSLPPELLADAARRLGWLALIYTGAIVVGHFGRRAALTLTGASPFGFELSDMFALAGMAMGIAVYFASRSQRLSSHRVLDVGLFFQIAGAFGIAATELSAVPLPTVGTLFAYFPAECIWIVLFPVVVPNTPSKALTASLLSASMGPAALGLVAAVTGTAVPSPVVVAAYYLTTNYLCAVIAYVVARIVHRFSMRLKQLREIGSYELLERIGEGGMGEVWRAKHRLLARPAAIKLIRSDLLGASQRTRDAIVQRFEREAKDTAMLGSTHTIDVHDFGTTEDGDFYYVMELLDGVSLERFVQLYGPMEPARVVYVLQQVCHSLGEAHARGLVHRDIKPANIFMCRLGPDDDFVKVLDFGLVKHVETGAAMLTKEGVTAGTPAYMAPEVALGQPGVDGRADIYALGCVAYYLLTGQPVFSADSDVAIALAHVKDEPVRPSLRSEFDISPALEALILDSLAKEPAARPASAELFSERVAAALPEDAWTPRRARAWWELHRIELAHTPTDASATDTDNQPAAVVAEPCRRCWPRFDRKPLTHASVVGQ
jgi:eukaryotic-like serine/threonine-protein kinase